MADLTITAANVLAAAGATIKHGTAGASITAGQSLYQDASDSNSLKLAQHDGTAAEAECVGVALNAAEDGQPVAYVSAGNYNPGATVAVGTCYAVGAGAGGVAPIADVGSGDYNSVIGIATTTTNIKVQILNGGVDKP